MKPYAAPRNGREATPFWNAARRGVLLLPFDKATGRPVWPPTDEAYIEWRECAAHGTLASFSVVRRPVQPEWKDAAPYVVALIQIDGGPRLLSNLVDCDPALLEIGAAVRCSFVDTQDPDLGLPVFRVVRT